MTHLLPAALVVLLVTAAPAAAAVPFSAGTGRGPDVATGADGSGHVAFVNTDSPGDFVGYCRVPARGAGCNATHQLGFPGGAAAVATNSDAQVFAPQPGKVVVIASCFVCGAGGAADRTFLWISTDNGATFDAGTEIGSLAIGGGTQGIWFDLSGQYLGAAGRNVQSMTTPASTTSVVASPFSTNSGPSVAFVPGTRNVLYVVNDLHTFRFALFTDPEPVGATPAEFNTQANWATNLVPTAAEADNVSETMTSFGVSGAFLTYRFFVPGDNHLVLRRFDPAAGNFTAPRNIEGASPIDDSVDDPDSFQDAAGRLHVVWRSLFDGGRLRYIRSDDGGATFTVPASLGTGESYVDPQISANATGSGWAAWQGNGPGPIRVVALDPRAEAGGRYSGPSKLKSTSVSGATITFSTPRNCVPVGASFRVRLEPRRSRRQGSLFVRITRADFFVGSTRVAIDRRAPFVQTLIISGARPGTTSSLRARAYIKVRRGRAPKRSVTATVRTC